MQQSTCACFVADGRPRVNGVVSVRRSLSMSSSCKSGGAPLMWCAFEEFKEEVT
jgi:hypothetical protein